MKGLSLVFILLSAIACLPQPKVRNAALSDGAGGGTTTPPPTSTSDVELAWYLNLTSSSVLTLFRDQNDNAYIRGRRIENFLLKQNDPTATYCLEADLGSSVPAGDKRFLRLRAVPLSVNNIVQGNRTIYLRVDFGNTAAGAQVCNRNKIQYVNDTQTETIPFINVQSVTGFTLAEACASCATQIVTQNFRLFKVDTATAFMTQVKRSELDLGVITLALRPGNAPVVGGTCTNSACGALGFSCCLDNQCVNDGATRPGVNQQSSAYTAAENERLANPLAFLKYPQFYFICSTTQPQVPDNTTGNPNQADAAAQARLAEMRRDHSCIEDLKANSVSTPFHLAPFNQTAANAGAYDPSKCNVSTATDNFFWERVLNRLYVNCGCDPLNTNLAMRLANCPKYEYQVVARDATGNPIQFACRVFDDAVPDAPFQRLDVAVSSRSVPHRFFDQNGAEVNLSSAATGTTQEGTAMSYADPEKLQPINGNFNMNSILGALNVSLTDAVPAKAIDVEVDQVYLIATRSGFYTPCPTCAKDSWFPSFTPTPTAGQGVGLQAVGHSTSRDMWDNNTTLGNYEDTIFGRACWVPPTMLPFSQPLSSASEVSQRRKRLETQATMWINGYQRDWYGFNKGALIGSFDGVTWFAVGKGRIVRSTTKKLFLAINAPFGDLAENSTHVVSVQAYEGQATAPILDFNPELVQNHPNQNEAGNCQAYHRCNVDADCVTRLGWEYSCADVTQLRTYWPKFNPVGATERLRASNEEPLPIEGILAQGVLPPGSTRRCVYRGAGAVCRTDAQNISAAELEKRKLLTCAPNFWCADVDSTNANIPGTSTFLSVFNKEIARFARPLDEVPVSNNHLFGQDANFLGRPLDYLHNRNSVPATNLVPISDNVVRSTIDANVTAFDPSAAGRVGLCRPGKRLPTASDAVTTWNPFVQHQGLDEFSRTDYISQIGSCPANYLSINKLTSCPVLDDGGTFIHNSVNFTNVNNLSAYARRALAQNSCGLETLRNGTLTGGVTADTLQLSSPFRAIEGRPLNSQLQVNPTLVRDACLRKAGSVCHTDLDCAPNKYHAEQMQFFDDSFFGNRPNREYYEQTLVCGQATPKPFFNSPEFDSYDLTLNRCCREVGRDLTTYSAQTPNGTNSIDPVTANLNPLATGSSEPTNAGRYERFSHVRNLGATFPVLSGFQGRTAGGTLLTQTYSGGLALTSFPSNAMLAGQWRTLNQANSNTCCGGGWVRKFSDGSTNWAKRDRVRVDVSNFRCLNYLSPLVSTTTPSIWGLTQPQIDSDYGRYCFDISGATGNCAQITMTEGSVDNLSCASREYDANPLLNPFYTAAQANYMTLPGIQAWSNAANIFSFFPPTSADSDPATIIDYAVTNGRRNITVFHPSYAGDSLITVTAHRTNPGNPADPGNTRTCAAAATSITGPTSAGSCPGFGGRCCYEYNATNRILRVAIIPGAPGDFSSTTPDNTSTYGVKVTYLPPGRGGGLGRPIAKPSCSDVHYLDILGKLELAGIPQITHQKILCNSNAEKLVPGLYNLPDTDSNRTLFNQPSFAFNSTSEWRTNHFGLQNGAVFSAQDFKCCTPAGKSTQSANLCCSGYAIEDERLPPGTLRCALPSGTNLSVYFNRFVSNEGRGDHLLSAPLADSDFNEATGEPLLTNAVNTKLVALGRELCENASTRRGGAFGNFRPEPSSVASQGQTVYGIVDSPSDVANNSSGGSTSETGFFAFAAGFRWNHHVYCE